MHLVLAYPSVPNEFPAEESYHSCGGIRRKKVPSSIEVSHPSTMSERSNQDWHLSAPISHAAAASGTDSYDRDLASSQAMCSQSPSFAATHSAPKWYPQLVNYTPRSGPGGTMVSVDIRATEWPAEQSTFAYSLLFGHTEAWATSTQVLVGADHCYHLNLQAPAPGDYNQTGDVHLTLKIQDAKGRSIAAVSCGIFTYEMSAPPPSASYHASTAAGLHTAGYTEREPSSSYSAAPMHPPVQPNYITSAIPSSLGQLDVTSPTAWSATSPAYSGAPDMHAYGSTPAQSPTSVLPTGYSHVPRRAGPMRHRSSPQTPIREDHADNTYARNPVLVRTSMLQSPSSEEATRYTPYLMYPSNKAVLRIDGDLDGMARGWSDEEKDIGRRLVQFSRDQQGNAIYLHFNPVTREERSPHSMCVSCIWWEEKQEAYVTSVDTIALLEKVVATRFTVEEKNRIRRNLEGFHPMTVSKAKCESFFTAIMRFPPPKPRNIEKDVKVFPWKILAGALKKIVGKYSASYTPPHHAHHNQPTLLRSASDSPGHEPSPSSASSAHAPMMRAQPLHVLPTADLWASSYTSPTTYDYTWRPAMPLDAALYPEQHAWPLDPSSARTPRAEEYAHAQYAPYDSALPTPDYAGGHAGPRIPRSS